MNEYQFCKDDWKIAARNIFLCVIGVVILTPITMFFASLSSISLMLDAMGKSVGESASWPNTVAAITGVLLLGLLVWYIMSLSKFKDNQICDESSSAVGTLRTCVIVQLAGVLIFLFSIISPLAGVVLFFLWCITLIIMQFIIKDAYKTLSEEETWSKVARRGASQLKTSVAYTIYGMFAPILWFLLFVLTILLVAGSKDMSWQVIIYDIVQGNYTAYLLPFFVLLICGLIQLYWGVMSFVLMLLGWNNIQSGNLVDPSEKEAKVASRQTNVSEQSTSNAVGVQNVQTPSFCPECGVKLAPGSKFCPSCGKSLLVVAAVTEQQLPESVEVVAECDATSDTKKEVPAAEPVHNNTFAIISTPAAESVPEYYDTDEDSEENNTRKWWLYGGITAGVVVLGLILWFLFARDRMPDGPISYVSADNASVFEGIEDSMISNYVGELEYGDSVVTYENDPSGELIKIKAKKNGENISGYVFIDRLLDKETFITLQSQGHFDNSDIRSSISDWSYRTALARTLKELGPDWSLLTTTTSNETSPAVKIGDFKGLPQDEVGFAFMTVNNLTDEKHFYLFTNKYMYSEGVDLNPILLYDESVNNKWNAISDITIKNNKVKVKYRTIEDKSQDAPKKETVEPGVESLLLKGEIDYQYPITMTLKINGKYVNGSYYYNKYRNPITLSGEMYENHHHFHDVSLTEMNNGEVTGQFLGVWDGETLSGKWLSPDGEKEMNFSVSK